MEIYKRRYIGKRPYGDWETINKKIYNSLYKAFLPSAKIVPDRYTRCVYEYRRLIDNCIKDDGIFTGEIGKIVNGARPK